jgi:hypothetical protein
MSYIGGGLLAGNLILTIVPVTMYAILVTIRIGVEEGVMQERFGQDYIERSWLDFVVVEEGSEIKAKSIGKFYYMAIALNASIAVLISQVFP